MSIFPSFNNRFWFYSDSFLPQDEHLHCEASASNFDSMNGGDLYESPLKDQSGRQTAAMETSVDENDQEVSLFDVCHH